MKTTKIFIVLAFISLTFSSFTYQEKIRIEKMTFHFVDLGIETPFQISCSKFETFFLSNYKTLTIKDSNELKEFANYLKKYNELGYAKDIDVRLKIIITYANQKKTVLCMDKFYHLFLNNKSISIDQNIIDFIIRHIN
jgi:hypothetical protein